MTRLFVLLLAALAAAAVAVAPAGAQSAAPTPCNGMFQTDGAGDQTIAPIGGGSAGLPHGTKGPDNIDIRGLFFNYRDGVLTANMVIQNLTSVVPAEARSGQVTYIFEHATVGDVAYMEAHLTSDGWSFVYGEFTDTPDPTGGVVIFEAETKGQVFEGPNGVISIEVPASAGLTAGSKLPGVLPRVSTADEESLFVNDQAPDGGSADAKEYTVVECPPVAATTETGGDGGTTTGGDGTQQQQQEGTQSQQSGDQQSAQQQKQEQGQTATPTTTKKSSCASKAKKKYRGKKNAKKRLKALKQCKKSAKRKRG